MIRVHIYEESPLTNILEQQDVQDFMLTMMELLMMFNGHINLKMMSIQWMVFNERGE